MLEDHLASGGESGPPGSIRSLVPDSRIVAVAIATILYSRHRTSDFPTTKHNAGYRIYGWPPATARTGEDMGEMVHTKASVLKSEEGESYWFLDGLVTVKVSGAQTSDRLTILDFLDPPAFSPPTGILWRTRSLRSFLNRRPSSVMVKPSRPGPIDFAAIGRAAARQNIEILGPPLSRPTRAATQFRPRTGRESCWAP